MTGSGFPQRFADLDGSMIDVYQAMTQVTDEAEQTCGRRRRCTRCSTERSTARSARRATTAIFNAILHSDLGDHTQLNDMVSEAVERGVPVVSSAQVLQWLDGRNGSSFADIAYTGGRLSFTLVTNDKARGLEAMLPARSSTGPLARIRRDGRPVSWTRRTVKGVEYAVFQGVAGAYEAFYETDTTAPDVSQVSATADAEGHAVVTWTTDEPSSSMVEYGRTAALGSDLVAGAPVTEHRIELTGLSPGTTYSYRVTSTDSAGNTAQTAAATFATSPGGLVDSRTTEFNAGTRTATHAGGTIDGSDGEVQLRPAVGEEFDWPALPAGWTSQPWGLGGGTSLSLGSLYADGAVAYPAEFFEPPRVIEFSATFRPVNNQGVGFSKDFSDFPLAAFTSGNGGDPFGIYASSGADPSTERNTALPGVALNVPAPLPHRMAGVERHVLRRWRPSRVPSRGDRAGDAPDRQRLRHLRSGRPRALAAPGRLRDQRDLHLAGARRRAGRARVADARRRGRPPERHGHRVRDTERCDA